MAVKVRTGNLVRPWSWVTWQVHAAFLLTRKPLSKASRESERRCRGERERQSRHTELQRKVCERLVCLYVIVIDFI